MWTSTTNNWRNGYEQPVSAPLLEAYHDAGLSGLCAEGRWEYTIGVLRQLDLTPLLNAAALVPADCGVDVRQIG
jgi:hypothetical protein